MNSSKEYQVHSRTNDSGSVGIKGIADEACRSRRRRCNTTRLDSCSMSIAPSECFSKGGIYDDDFEVYGDEDDSDDEDDEDRGNITTAAWTVGGMLCSPPHLKNRCPGPGPPLRLRKPIVGRAAPSKSHSTFTTPPPAARQRSR